VNTPIRTLLVANRGEIARRVIRTARAMGIRTIALHGVEDARAPYVADADLSVDVGRSGAATFLDAATIATVARAAGADGIHPGYGFLSERADAAQAVLDAGLTWIGPHPESIRVMGDKLASKQAAAEAGVPLLPSCALLGDDPEAWGHAVGDADVGYPLLVKASAGGGGRGMRLVAAPPDLPEAVVAARREAEASFGDATVFAERFVTRARHIEIQVAGDRHGHAIHLGERECSIQRRHQKVIEEAPSPLVDDALRAAMGDAAVRLALAIGYDSVGTVEYVVDADTGAWWFLEMNTRLQVEHPVTEAVTGLDLVRLQLELAAGSPLALAQDDVRIDGHAIEVRLVAEDPSHDWLPATGTVHRWQPDPSDGVRWDSAVEDESVVTASFDSLVAKGIAHAPTRTEAARILAGSLRRLRCHGLTTNRDLLVRTLDDPDFLAGALHTGFFDEHPDVAASRHDHLTSMHAVPEPAGRGPHGGALEDEVLLEVHPVAAVLWLALHERRQQAWPDILPGWRVAPAPAPLERVVLSSDSGPRPWAIQDPTLAPITTHLMVDGVHTMIHVAVIADPWPTPNAPVHAAAWTEHATAGWGGNGWQVLHADDEGLTIDWGQGLRLRVHLHRVGDRLWASSSFGETELVLAPRFDEGTRVALGGGPTAPVPGKVVAVTVAVGDLVTVGQVLVVLEAMKVEHRITANLDGVVAEVLVTPGATVDAHQLLVRVDEPDAGADGGA